MINLFENYSQLAIDLEYSLVRAGYKLETVVINDNGFLPPHVQTPLKFFLANEGERLSSTSPKFFNEVDIPNYWEIRGDNHRAEIYEGYKKRGEIHYSDRKDDYRIVQSVDWFNDEGRLRMTDLYNQNGSLFGKKTFSDGALVLTTFLNDGGHEVILFNHITNTIQLFYNKKYFLFTSYVEFVLFYFKCAQIDSSKINYNSLGLPFFITLALGKEKPETPYAHTLFWQEKLGVIPGNMKAILNDSKTMTKNIIIQDREEYLCIKNQLPLNTKVNLNYLGYLYEFKKDMTLKKSVLIVTHSDQIEKLQDIVEQLSNFEINIAARTEMSAKLMKFDHYSNVQLFPTVTTEELESLLLKSSLYFDINHGTEVNQIIRKAFEYHLLIFAFKNTVHQSKFMSKGNIFESDKYLEFIKKVKASTETKKDYHKALGQQLWEAGESTIEDYKEIIK
ncbi:accessory Sec system glycosylation chaperone GtfB [Lactococcus petauri]|uniref:UDP-N-acetylglucosamine--peptide N-acetylglucosaminyltransferase stabilizing protein GtfB n=1 Tax=Lactococcus petauri TaxID=1940789 RepID=A0A252CB39_9LACT|nr:accessory Sec system glycosylation chaperone GtfB [Lactococcus petauri]OUK02793.1 accessory Sec system glycosylation chaperone GtfB [Lactococcus petauri]